MSAAKAARSSLPDGWELCESKSTPGRQYYFNRKTGKSSWTEPKAETAHGASKQRSRKDKSSSQTKKEIIHKKSLKRKSDGHEQDYLYKKRKHETSLQRHRTESAKEESPSKRKIDKSSPNKQTPSKNLANNRLSQLRAQLNAEVSQEETSNPETPKANRLKSSPKTSQSETPTKNKKPDDKSPNSNDSKCSTTVQSPSNDSLHSIPSPSQFFTANKIISSMKAQLPDEFGKTEQIDTFASIEQGINNQTIEFPYSKHPATPPQFSQASKLVSAIKSKLSYSPGDSIRTFKTACERMEALRTSLSSEANESNSFIESSFISNPKETISQINEAMDIEEYKKIEVSAPKVVEIDASQSSCEQNVTLVVDTNIFIHELDLIKNVLNSHIKGYSEQPILLVPWRVINELDRLKDNNNGNGAICKRARAAMDYLYKSLPENSRIKGQSLRDSNSHIYPCELPDDEILNCCLQQAERGKSVILLSNDKNLCSKATVNGIKSKSLDELKCLLESKPQDVVDPELSTCLKYCQDTVYQLLSNILENEMRAKYNNLWEHVIFKAPPWTLSEVLQCLLKHWIAVFTDVFPRIEHLILDLKNSLSSIENKDVKSLSQSEVSNFKELCIDVAKRCQIIPEYMDLAKLTVERLERGSDRDSDYNEREMVIDAFEKVWTVFSSYCSKVCTAMGIPHNIEDCLPNNESLEVLTTKLPVFAGHIAAFSVALNGVLTLETDDVRLDEMMSQLEETFKTCLIVIYVDSEMVNKESLKVFCANCRSMLQEASEKFAQLTELLQVCNSRIDIDINLN